MREILFVACVIMFFVTTSCKKDYTCVYTDQNGVQQVVTYNNVSGDGVDAVERKCDALGGEFEKK